MKEKNDKLDFKKKKLNTFELQRTVKKIKRQAMHWEKIFADHTSDKVFVSKTYKEL